MLERRVENAPETERLEQYLIDAGFKEELGKACQRFLTEIAASVEIAAAWLVAGCKARFIFIGIAGKAAGD